MGIPEQKMKKKQGADAFQRNVAVPFSVFNPETYRGPR